MDTALFPDDTRGDRNAIIVERARVANEDNQKQLERWDDGWELRIMIVDSFHGFSQLQF